MSDDAGGAMRRGAMEIVGKNTRQRAQATRWAQLAECISEVLYCAYDVHMENQLDGKLRQVESSVTSARRMFVVPREAGHVSAQIPGVTNKSAVDVIKLLHALRDECEMAAVREVTE